MTPPRRKMMAHPNTYWVGNVLVIAIMSAGPALMIWYLVPSVLGRLVLWLIVYLVAAALEHQYCTGVVARIVERLFPNEAETQKHEQLKARLEEVRRRGHW